MWKCIVVWIWIALWSPHHYFQVLSMNLHKRSVNYINIPWIETVKSATSANVQMYITTLRHNRLPLKKKIYHFPYVQSSVWKWARGDGIWLCRDISVILYHQLSPLNIFGQPTAKGRCQYCVHTDNPFPRAKISISEL